MKAYVYLFTLLGIAFFVVLGVAAGSPQAREASRLADELLVQEQVIFARAETKQHIVEDVIAGRLTLPEAADKFGELNSEAPESMTAVRLTIAGKSDKERLCREVIHRVKVELEERTSEAERVVPRLEREMHEHLGEAVPGA